MKKYTTLHPTTMIFAAGLVALTLNACSKHDRNDIADKTKDAYHDTAAAVSKGWDNLKSYSFDKRSEFSKEIAAQQADFDAGVSKLRAEYSETQASASRKAAMSELKDAEANYKEKLAALGNATSDTWDAARDNVILAWDKLQAAYKNARAGN
jgi:hypothetical protein